MPMTDSTSRNISAGNSDIPDCRARGSVTIGAHHDHGTRLRTVIIDDSDERIFLSVGVVVTPLKT